MSVTRIKMCGMTREEDVVAAAQLGVDAIGMVFYPPSPRSIDLEQAHSIAAACPMLVDKIVLFVNPDPGYVRDVLAATGAQYIQFHGEETPEFCQQFSVPYLKALRVKDSESLKTLLAVHYQAPGILLDAYVPGQPGGTGQGFDWTMVPDSRQQPLFLAGGLTPDNVQDAIQVVKPYAVDVSGGIELSKGIKSYDKMAAFVKAVREISS